MEFLIPLLLFFIAFNPSPTWATNGRISSFKGIVCNQCQQWCDNADLVTTGSMRVDKVDLQGPFGRAGGSGPPGEVDPVSPTGPQGEINMTPIEKITDRELKENFQLFNVSSCNGAKLESAVVRNDSGGVFKFIIPEVGVRNVFCDVADDGGNWTVFQRRKNGNVDFYRSWDDYVNGFGDLQGDHWLGLEAMHQLTKDGNMEMKIQMIKKNGVYWVAKYSDFRIGPRSDFYRLNVSGYSGNATRDGLTYHSNWQFSTKDADHDIHPSLNCASHHEGGWWYRDCAFSNLNGNFNQRYVKGIWWKWGDDDGRYNLMRFSEMKFRKRS